MKQILLLFLDFLKIGMLSIGGGYAAIPLIQQQVVKIKNWITLQEFTDIITISQMTPGPLAVNTATFVGLRVAKVSGAVAATLGCVLCGVILSICFYQFLYNHQNSKIVNNILDSLRASSTGLIACAAVTIILLVLFPSTAEQQTVADKTSGILFFIGFFILRKWKLNPILIILISGIIGVIFL